MKLRLLLLSLAMGTSAPPAAAQAPLAKGPAAKALRVYSLQAAGQWGADISPDGRTVGIAIQRTGLLGGQQHQDIVVEAELWDFRAKKRLAQRTLAHRPYVAVTTAEWGQVSYTGDGQALLIYDGELLNVLKPTSLEEITRIDLGLPAMPREAEVVDLAAPRTAHGLVAVLVSRGGGRGGDVRVYDLQSGALRRTWEFDKGYFEFGSHIAWSPDGKKLAVTLVMSFPGQRLRRDAKNIQVLEAASGKLLAQWNTGYLAGPVAFARDTTVLTATVEMPWMTTAGAHPIKAWNAGTGRLVREISSPPTGVRATLEVSADGRRVLGYIGQEEGNGPTRDPEDVFDVREQRFRLWDWPTGRVVATSPHIQPNPGKRIQLRMNARGDVVLGYWRLPDQPLLIYEIP